jgi:ribosomal protein S18 acetylase RimI-like enzyme
MVKIITPTETYSLRRSILRKNTPNESHEFNGDFDENTFHLGYFEENNLLGIVTLMMSGDVAQLRGMAVDENHQGKSIGRKLVLAAEEILTKKDTRKIWMNARETAVPFYEKLGYKTEGEIFMIKPIGFHYLMTKYFDL